MPNENVSVEEKRLGLELFFTDTPGIKGRVKAKPEDFIVNERSINVEPITSSELETRDKTSPLYTYATVTTKNWETNRLLHKLGDVLNISTDNIYFAGSKDKRAITTQLMAFHAPIEDIQEISIADVEFSNIFQSPRLLKIGDLIGNDFEITITDPNIMDSSADEAIKHTLTQLKKINGFPNLFGVQRFGIIRPNTHKIGKLIIQKHFEEALLLYIGHPIQGEPEEDFEARKEFDSCWDFEWALNNYPKHLYFERTLIRYLLRHPDDFLGAIEQLPKNLGTMFIHSYQSYLFNKIVCERIKMDLPLQEPIIGDIVLPIDENKLPLHKTWIPVTEDNIKKLSKQCIAKKAYTSAVLFGSETGFCTGEFGEIERKIIQNEQLEPNNFIIPDLPQLSSKGSRREIVAPFFNFQYKILKDGIKFSFGLIKGVYATILLREFMKSPIRNY